MTVHGDHLLFRVDDAVYAVDAAAVREVHWLPELAPLVGHPPSVLGAVNLRGTLVPVVDLRRLFGRPARPLRVDDALLILQQDAASLGVVVSQVLDVRPIALLTDDYAVSRPVDSDVAPVVFGVAQAGDDLATVLCADALIAIPGAGGDSTSLVARAPEAEPESAEARALLRQRAADLRADLSTADNRDGLTLALFRLNGEPYAVGVDAVREFRFLGSVTPVPCCPPHIRGLINLRGEVLTVVDIRDALSLPTNNGDATTQVLVADVDGIRFGIAVERVDDVIQVPCEAVRPVPAAAPSRGTAFVKSSVIVGDLTVAVLDLPRLLAEGALIIDEEV